MLITISLSFFFFNATSITEIYTLSLHDALPIWVGRVDLQRAADLVLRFRALAALAEGEGDDRARVGVVRLDLQRSARSEEHTSELQSRLHLVCRLLLEKKKQQ